MRGSAQVNLFGADDSHDNCCLYPLQQQSDPTLNVAMQNGKYHNNLLQGSWRMRVMLLAVLQLVEYVVEYSIYPENLRKSLPHPPNCLEF